MCGHVGIAGGSLMGPAREIFRQLLIIDSLRGTHGTGAASVGGSGDVDWCKRAGHVYDLLDYKAYDRVVGNTSPDKKVLIGHNRHATFGAHTADNAHPFAFKHVVGAHNGTLESVARYKLVNWNKFDTDSEAYFDHIDSLKHKGATIQEAMRETVKMLTGAWAFVSWFTDEKKLVFLRNDKRTLYYAFLEGRKYLVWASEHWMIRAICFRENVKIDDDKIMIFSEDVGTMFSIPAYNGVFDDPVRFSCKGKAPVAYKASDSFQNGAVGVNRTSTTAYTEVHKPQQPLVFPNENNNSKFNFKNPYKDHDGTVLKKVDFDKKIKQGTVCCYCNNHTPVWGEAVCFVKPNPMGDAQYLCKQCIADPQIMELARAIR